MNYLLFTTSKCHKCPEFKEYIRMHIDFNGTILDENSPDFSNTAKEFNITSAPHFIIFNDDNNILFRTGDLSELATFIQTK